MKNIFSSTSYLLVFTFLVIFKFNSSAQFGSVISSFNASDNGSGIGEGSNFPIHSIAAQADGKLLLGGEFTTYNRLSVNKLIRVDTNGIIDPSFNFNYSFPDYLFHVKKILVQPDGKIVCLISQNSSSSVFSVSTVVRFNSDGSVDNTFSTGTGFLGVVNDILLQPDGKLLAAGNFTSFDNQPVSRLARLNTNGTLDNTLSTGTSANNVISKIDIQPDGKIILMGSFTNYNGVAKKYLARVNSDGSIDNSFSVGASTNMIPENFKILSNGKILIVGEFSSFSGNAVQKAVKINSNGSFDSSFNLNYSFSAFTASGNSNVTIDRLIEISDNKYAFAVNSFPSYFVQDRSELLLTDSLGQVQMNANVSHFINHQINANLLKSITYSNNRLYVGGAFTAIAGKGKTNLAKLNFEGEVFANFNNNTGARYTVLASAVQADGKIIIGGKFNSYNGNGNLQLSRINPDGTVDPTFNCLGGFDGIYSSIEKIVIQPDGKIIVGGAFSTFNNLPKGRLVRLNSDGSIDNSFLIGNGFNQYSFYFPPNDCGVSHCITRVKDIAIQPDGKIWVCGNFSQFNGVSVGNLIRLNSNGTLDLNLNLNQIGVGGRFIRRIRIQDDGKILVGLQPPSVGISPSLVRLNSDGTIDSGFNFGTFSSFSFELLPNGKILNVAWTGNSFKLFRFHSNGLIDSTFNQNLLLNTSVGFSDSIDLKLIDNEKILIYNKLLNYNNQNVNRLAVINQDGVLDNSFNIGTGPNGNVKTVSVLNDGNLLIGGDFTSINGVGKNRLALLEGDTNTFTCTNLALQFDSIILPNCSSSSGGAYLNASGGTAPYNFNWQSPINSTNQSISFYNLGGTYTATVTDFNGCTKTASLMVNSLSFTSFDLNSNLIVQPSFRPGFPTNLTISSINTSCISQNGQIKLVVDSNIINSITNINPPVSLVSADTLIWNFNNFSLGSGNLIQNIQILTPLSAAIGDTFDFTLIIAPINGDSIPTNNIKVYDFLVVNSFDPNDKQVYPKGECLPNYITNSQKLTYTLRYQNTGNSHAINVNIIDSLSSSLNLNSLRVVANSHPTHVEVLPGNVVNFVMNNIYLPDSATNPLLSNGYIVFEIDQNPNLANGTLIENKAGIYFDFNQPVITNTVFNTVSNGGFGNNYIVNNVSACNSFNFNNTNYVNSGTYNFNFTNIYGCDSLVQLNLLINQPSQSVINHTSCGSFVLNNQTYNSSGVYYQTLPNSDGCDSLIQLNLVINHPSQFVINQTACGSFVLNNQTYNASGVYFQTFVNSAGCDSLVRLNLTIKNPSSSNISQTACSVFELNNQVYTTSGIYTQIVTNHVGCDSTINLDLEIIEIDNTVTQNGFSLVSNQMNASYQWIDCNNPQIVLTNANSQSFSPLLQGNYAVIITLSSCTDTSNCVFLNPTSIQEFENHKITVYPNPTNGEFRIKLNGGRLDGNIRILNYMGQKITEIAETNNQEIFFDLTSFSSGIYFIEILIDDKVFKTKIFKY